MIWLSLFDGMSCGRLAAERSGIPVTKYYASEKDKHAISLVKAKWPDTIHIGDVEKVRYDCGWLYWDGGSVETEIDYVIGGSPCQGFSFAGDGLAFDDPRSKLFFEYARILKEIQKWNPEVEFLLENVVMKAEHVQVITGFLGIEPIQINSALLSAQNRERLYWTNIAAEPGGLFGDLQPGITQPRDKGIILKDILQPEDQVDKKYYLSKKALRRLFANENFLPKVNPEKTGTLNTKNNSGELSRDNGTTIIGDGVVNDNGDLRGVIKSTNVDANYHKGMDNHAQRTMILSSEREIIQLPRGKNEGGVHEEKSPTMSANSWQQNNLIKIPENTKKGFTEIHDGECVDLATINSATRRGRRMKDKAHTMTSAKNGLTDFHLFKDMKLRRLTLVECCRLQTVPDDYFWIGEKQLVSDTQVYKMLGNGWTIDIIAHILKHDL